MPEADTAPLPHSYLPDRKWTLLMTVARLKANVTVPAAQSDTSAVVRHMAETSPRCKTRDANVLSLGDEMGRQAPMAGALLPAIELALAVLEATRGNVRRH